LRTADERHKPLCEAKESKVQKRFFLAVNGEVKELRSSFRAFTHASFGTKKVSFHLAKHNAPMGRVVVEVRELTKAEAEEFKRIKAHEQTPEFKRDRLIGLIYMCGIQQMRAAQDMHAVQMQMMGRPIEACDGEPVLRGFRFSGDLSDRLVMYQEQQASAYRRMCLHRRALAKLEAGEG
jgi:hypothetical protein